MSSSENFQSQENLPAVSFGTDGNESIAPPSSLEAGEVQHSDESLDVGMSNGNTSESPLDVEVGKLSLEDYGKLFKNLSLEVRRNLADYLNLDFKQVESVGRQYASMFPNGNSLVGTTTADGGSGGGRKSYKGPMPYATEGGMPPPAAVSNLTAPAPANVSNVGNAGVVFVSNNDTFQLKSVSHKSLLELREYLRVQRDKQYPCNLWHILSEDVQKYIFMVLVHKKQCQLSQQHVWLNIPVAQHDEFVKLLLTYFPHSDVVAVGSLEDQVNALKLDYRPEDITSVQPFLTELNRIWDRLPVEKQTAKTAGAIAKLLQPIIKASGPEGFTFGDRLAAKMAHGGHPETPMEFGVRMIAAVDDLRLAWHEVSKCIGPEWRNLLRQKSNHFCQVSWYLRWLWSGYVF